MGEFFRDETDDNELERILNLTLQNRQEEIINRQFGNVDITADELNALYLYCHFDFKKHNKECCVCLEKKLSHKCSKCTAFLCELCLININKNKESNNCPNCRYKFSIDEYINKTEENMHILLNKYGENSIGEIIMKKPLKKKYNDDKNTTLKGDYNYRENKLEISCSDQNLKIKLDIKKYKVSDQNKVFSKMDNICSDMISSKNHKLWNTNCNKISQIINKNGSINEIFKL